MGGVGGPASSKGHSGELAGRNVLTVLNAVFNKAQFWDGRAADLKEQVVLGVMANPSRHVEDERRTDHRRFRGQ